MKTDAKKILPKIFQLTTHRKDASNIPWPSQSALNAHLSLSFILFLSRKFLNLEIAAEMIQAKKKNFQSTNANGPGGQRIWHDERRNVKPLPKAPF
jgi:hypothetical protein